MFYTSSLKEKKKYFDFQVPRTFQVSVKALQDLVQSSP